MVRLANCGGRGCFVSLHSLPGLGEVDRARVTSELRTFPWAKRDLPKPVNKKVVPIYVTQLWRRPHSRRLVPPPPQTTRPLLPCLGSTSFDHTLWNAPTTTSKMEGRGGTRGCDTSRSLESIQTHPLHDPIVVRLALVPHQKECQSVILRLIWGRPPVTYPAPNVACLKSIKCLPLFFAFPCFPLALQDSTHSVECSYP